MARLIIIALLFIMAGCCTKEKCYRKYPPQVITETKDSIVFKEKIEYKDTTIYVKLKPDTIVDSVIVEVINDLPHSQDTIIKQNDYSVAKAWTAYGYTYLNLMAKDTALMFKLDSAIQKASYWEELYKTTTKVEVHEVKYIPGFYKFTFYFFLVIAGGAFVFLAIKVGKYL